MSLSSWLWGSSQVDEAVDKATSELLPSGTEDIALNLEICDQIRSKAVQPKDAVRALKRRLNHKNPNVQLLALNLTDICIKNGGDHFLVEVASRDFMDNLVSILKMPVLNMDVKNRILKLVQNWAMAFEGKPSLYYVGQVHKTLKSEGFNFPPLDHVASTSAMVDTQTAPEWIDSDVCLRCRTAFSFTNRKHHCRNCGQVFDQQCSSKTLPLPHFGIAQEVRVCDACHMKLTKREIKVKRGHSGSRHRSARDLADEELQRAIQMSLEEVGAASVNGRSHRPGYVPSYETPSTPYSSSWYHSEPPLVDRKTRPSTVAEEDEETDPELKAAIEASLRESNAPQPSAPAEAPQIGQEALAYLPPALPNYDLQPLESDAILTFSQTVEQVEAQGGRDMSRFPAVNELYDRASGLRPKLAMSLDDTDRKEKTLTDMHEKLSQAVKLYDSLLTQQLNRPSWRAAPVQSEPTRYNTVEGPYSQSAQPATHQPQRAWTYGTQPQSSQYPLQQQPTQQQMLPQQTGPSVASTPFQPMRQDSYLANQPPAQYNPAPSHQHQYSMSQSNGYQPPAASASTPVSIPQNPPPPQMQTQIGPPPSSYTQYSAVPPPAQQHVQPAAPASNQYYAQQAVPPPPTQTLSRSNTLSYNSAAAGHSTINGALSPAPVSSPQQIASHSQPPPQPLPHFPTAPTSNPQSYTLYGPSAPTGFEQAEQKEALLIDL